MRETRVLHVCETAKGGVGSYVSLFAGFEPGDLRSTVIAPAEHADHLDGRLDIRTYAAPRRGPVAWGRMLAGMVRAMRGTRPDVVFCHSTFTLIALVALRLSLVRVPVIYCAHGWAVSRYPHRPLAARLARLVEGTLAGLADAVVNISAHDRKLAEDLGYLGHHVLIENAVPDTDGRVPDDLFGPHRDGIHLLFVGRHDRQKGLDLLLAAFAAARARRRDITLHVVGEGVNRDAPTVDGVDGVVLHGWVDARRIDGWFRSADALIAPSRWEGFGLVVAEAFRNGTPALVSNRGALPALVEDGLTGRVFPLAEPALAELLGTLDAETLRAMRPACRAAYDRRFTPSRFRRDFRAMLHDLMTVRAQAAGQPAE